MLLDFFKLVFFSHDNVLGPVPKTFLAKQAHLSKLKLSLLKLFQERS